MVYSNSGRSVYVRLFLRAENSHIPWWTQRIVKSDSTPGVCYDSRKEWEVVKDLFIVANEVLDER